MEEKKTLDKGTTEEGKQPEDRQKPLAASKPKSKRKPKGKKQKEPQKPQPTKASTPKRAFPSVTLEEALKVPQVIRQKNNGHPWETGLVATACGTTPKGPKFFYLASAARDYGLTIGSRDTPQISLRNWAVLCFTLHLPKSSARRK
jgi:hypothetical protein